MKVLANDLRSLSLPDLEEKYKQIKTELLHVRQKQQTQTIKAHEIYQAKRNVAVVMSVLREKKLEEKVALSVANGEKLKIKTKMSKKKRMELRPEQKRRCRNGKSRIYRKSVLYSYTPVN